MNSIEVSRARTRLLGLAARLALIGTAAAPLTAQFAGDYDGGVRQHEGRTPLPVLVMLYQSNSAFDPDRMSLLGRDGTAIYQIAKNRSNDWFKRIPISFPVGAADDPVPFRSSDEQTASFFVLGADGYVYQSITNRYSAMGMWSAYSSLPRNVKLASTCVAVNTPDGRGASAFAVGQDGRMYSAFFTRGPSGGWSSWSAVPHTPANLVGRPTVTNSADGTKLHILVTDADGLVQHQVFARGGSGGWSKYAPIGGQTFLPTPSSYALEGLLSVFATGVDGAVYQSLYSGGGWSTPNRVSSVFAFSRGPSCVNSPNGKTLELICTNSAGDVYLRTFTRDGGGWSQWMKWSTGGRLSGTATLANWHTPLLSKDKVREQLFGARDSVAAWFNENSYGKFGIQEAYITDWLTMPDNPNTLEVDESGFDYLHGPDNAGKAELMIGNVEQLTGGQFKFADYDINVLGGDGEITLEEMLVYWIYPGKLGRLREAPTTQVPSLGSGKGVTMKFGLPRTGTEAHPGVAAEEMIHGIFDLRDLYETDDLPGYVGPGGLSMISRDEDFPHLNPWGKLKLRWIEPQVVQGDGWYTLTPIENRNDQCLLIHDPNRGTRDYFLVENRMPDASSIERNLKDRGIGVWRVSEHFAKHSHRDRRTLQLLRAGGPGDDSLAFFDAADPRTANHLTPTSSPSTRWFDNISSEIAIYHFPDAISTARLYVDVPPLRQSPPPPYVQSRWTYVNQKAPFSNPVTPWLTPENAPRIDSTFSLRVPASTATEVYVLVTGFSNPNVVAPWLEGYLYASTDVLIPIPQGGLSMATVSIPIPDDPALLGLDFYQQVARVPVNQGQTVKLSRGGHGVIGS